MKSYNVLFWDFNKDDIVPYDIMPYLLDEYDKELKRKNKGYIFFKDNKVPKTFEEYKYFIDSVSRYQFWARCEYEIIVTGWPVQKRKRKIDVYFQISQNIDIITKIFLENINFN